MRKYLFLILLSWSVAAATTQLGTPVAMYGAGSPEGSVNAFPGSYYIQSNGGFTNIIWFKLSLGWGNTGWTNVGVGTVGNPNALTNGALYQPANVKLTNFVNLANGVGALTNDGSGNYGWGVFTGTSSSNITDSGTNILIRGNLLANGGNFTDTLTLNGMPVLTNAPAGTASTNITDSGTNIIVKGSVYATNFIATDLNGFLSSNGLQTVAATAPLFITVSGTNATVYLTNQTYDASNKTNMLVTGNVLANGGAFTNTLTLNGVAVLTNSAAAIAGTVINTSVTGPALLAVQADKTNGTVATAAMITTTLGYTPQNGTALLTNIQTALAANSGTTNLLVIGGVQANYVKITNATVSKIAVIDGSGYITNGTVAEAGLQTALGYTPVNKAGDTMTGTLTVTGLTNSALTASKIVLSAADKSLTSSSMAIGDLSLNQTYKNIWIDAGAMTPQSSTAPEAGTFSPASGVYTNDVLKFDTSTEESAQFKMIMPDDWDTGVGIKAKFVWSSPSTNSAATNVAIWGITAFAYTNSMNVSTNVFPTAVTVWQTSGNTMTVTNAINVTAATAALTPGYTPYLGQPLYFKVTHPIGGASSNIVLGDVSLHGVQLQYKTLATQPAVWTSQ